MSSASRSPSFAGRANALGIEKDFTGSGEVSRKIRSALLLQQGDGAALLLQAIYLARQFRSSSSSAVRPQVVCVLPARVHFVEHLRNARKRESQRCEALDAQQAHARSLHCSRGSRSRRAAAQARVDGVIMAQRAHRHPASFAISLDFTRNSPSLAPTAPGGPSGALRWGRRRCCGAPPSRSRSGRTAARAVRCSNRGSRPARARRRIPETA